jgi:hypothetical protein
MQRSALLNLREDASRAVPDVPAVIALAWALAYTKSGVL